MKGLTMTTVSVQPTTSEPNEREVFELKIAMEYEQPPCIDRDVDGYADGYVDNAWWGWQAAWQHQQNRIDELKADNLKIIDSFMVKIESLQAKLNVSEANFKSLCDKNLTLEGKLNVAVDALGDIASKIPVGDEMIYRAIEALAEIKRIGE
jgi:hypothetical protein